MASVPPWSELPEDLLRDIIARLKGDPTDCASFRAVCYSWRLVPSPYSLPRVVFPLGFLLKPLESACHEFSPFTEGVRCVGSTDNWLACDSIDETKGDKKRVYSLFNLSSDALVRLPELDDAVLAAEFKVRKALMDLSLPYGLVALRTNSYRRPMILVRPGKGVWLPEPTQEAGFFVSIIDLAFLGGRLYGITQAEELYSFGITFDSHGAPTIDSTKCVVVHPNNAEGQEEDSGSDSGSWITVDEDEDDVKEYIVDDGIDYDVSCDDHDFMATLWYLVESRGKLLMVKRQVQLSVSDTNLITSKVEVFEADMGTATWVPVSGGLGGHALFISKRFSKSIPASKAVEEDGIYFVDTGEVFNLRSQTTSPPNRAFEIFACASWVFLPGSF